MSSRCRACDGAVRPFADGRVLGDVDVSYLRCDSCGLVMADDPTWLDAAYADAIAHLDVGLLDRCQILANVTSAVLRAERLRGGRFLDWAGGYGVLTRLMRDRGFDFAHTDVYADNIFAGGFTGDLGEDRYDLVTAFEVLEHLVDPVGELAPVASATDRLLVTTQVLPSPAPRPGEWDYYAEESGQHITFYTPQSLQALARRLGFDGVVTSSLVHLFHRGPVSPVTRALVRRPAIGYGLGHLAAVTDRRHSLLMRDHDTVRDRLARGR
ncbi:class I SAM-dependent methyltransferase [Nocardioides cavernae]|uniref:Class I SAM-dependent methyltransferase n=1 Tax=Nocardioides cavernae TaxID=1921566 RepID=A0ABR8NEW5_9ACTN|nr:class I SAM-dependent methyltransferase [Nocardioides cavernae]MBD3926651.1 class I SAM-dependent methyltransferase [Nocardioides cavernae]MBM7512373.1 hypothetical protein [Nocardioides cavernae]